MFSGLLILISLCIVMTIASLLAGALPLSFALSPSQVRLISTVGMGVLVGTSLVVIIPEGVETLYSARPSSSSSVRSSQRRNAHVKSLDVRWPETRIAAAQDASLRTSSHRTQDGIRVPSVNDFNALPGPVIPTSLPTRDTSPPGSTPAQDFTHQSSSEDQSASLGSVVHTNEGHARERSAHAYVGASLLLGFVLMYLVEKIPQLAANAKTYRRPHHFSLEQLSQGLTRNGSVTGPGRGRSGGLGMEEETDRGELDDDDGMEESSFRFLPSPRQIQSLATTAGLVIHAGADGIALGASSTTANTKLGFMVFLAIMLHKAPAAFGLTSVLLKQGLGKRRARAHLLIFSLAAPVGALSTWFFVNIASRGGRVDGEDYTQWWTGIMLLFSAGTFLYVAMHTMQEDSSSAATHHHPSTFSSSSLSAHDLPFSSPSSPNGYLNGNIGVSGSGRGNGSGGGNERMIGGNGTPNHGPRLRDILATVGGMLIPLLMQVGHGH